MISLLRDASFRRLMLTLLLIVPCFVWASGCTDQPANSVRGKVTVDGEAAAGKVTFVLASDSKKTYEVGIAPNGDYFRELPVGNYKVMVEAPFAGVGGAGIVEGPKDKKPEEKGKIDTSGIKTAGLGASPPKKYGSVESSGLTYEQKGGRNTWDIKLTK